MAALRAALRELNESRLGVRLEPLRISEARLEGHSPLLVAQLERARQQRRGRTALLLVRPGAPLRQPVNAHQKQPDAVVSNPVTRSHRREPPVRITWSVLIC